MNETATTSSFTNNTPNGFPRYALPISATVLTIQVAFAVFGVLGNALVCVVITKRASMKTSMNLYLRNLAITDLGVLLINFPLAAHATRTTTGWPFGRFLCLYISPAFDMVFGASIWSIAMIAIERYKNIISRKVFVKKVESYKRVTLKIALIWLVSFAVVAFPMYPIYVFQRYPGSVHCYPMWPSFLNNFMFKAYAVCLAIFWYLLPLGIITITYWKISAKLRQSNTFHKTMHGQDTVKSKLLREEEQKRLKQNKKAQRILTPLVVIFALSMLPLNVFRLVHGFVPGVDPRMKHFIMILDLCILGIVINSAVDPLIYYLCSKEFRRGIKVLLGRSRDSREMNDTTIQTRKTITRSLRRSPEIGTHTADSSPM